MEINYKGTDLEEIYKLALVGADFVTEKNENGVTVVDSLKKHLYIKTVLLSRFLSVFELQEDRVMSIEQYNKYNFSAEDFKGRGVKRLRLDYAVFVDMLENEINNIVFNRNDAIQRFNETLAIEFTPDKLENLKKQQDELFAQIQKAKN
ncbi:MAG: hypothetical protein IJN54_01870 [Lachnospiraceae bacterium]|nr:hypothetical protein [Lachnospiraceae bacterium]